MTVEEALARKCTRGVVAIGPKAMRRKAARLMDERSIGALVVLDTDGTAVGVVTSEDAMAWMVHQVPLDEPVENSLPSGAQTCRHGDDLLPVLQRMLRDNHGYVPVCVDGGKVADILSLGDIASHISAELPKMFEAARLRVIADQDRGATDSVPLPTSLYALRALEQLARALGLPTVGYDAARTEVRRLSNRQPEDEIDSSGTNSGVRSASPV